MTVEVKACRDCPFCDFVPPAGVWSASWHCKHPDSRDTARVRDFGEGRPRWCPLAGGGTLVELSKQAVPPR